MHDLFEKNASERESIIDSFYLQGSEAGGNISCDLSDEADEEHVHRILEKDIYVKLEQ